VSYKQDNWNNYKIIYDGSGGGLLLCYIDINKNSSAIVIQSIVVIGRNDVINHCKDYNSHSKCELCQEDHHLEDGKCVKNIEGCVNYLGNICLKCKQYMVIVENRCLSGCMELGDLNNVEFFQNKVEFTQNRLTKES